MFEEAISLFSIWASMNSWLTPTVLFLLLNLMIGTIAVTSGFTSYKPFHHHHLNHPDPSFHHHLNHHQPPQLQHQHQHQHQYQYQPQLTRAPSVLQRLKSINLYTFYSHPPTTHLQPPPPQQQPQQQSEPHQPNSPITTTTVSTTSVAADEDYENPTLDEIYSRIKQDNSIYHYGRQNSDTKPSGGEIPVKLSKKMKKSASDKSAFNHFHLAEETENVGVGGALNHTAVQTVEEEDVEEERENAVFVQQEREDQDVGVDAKADDFINRFKKQLQMQRADSIVRYKEMVSRTSAQ